jgi:hypothetical protein
MSNDQTFTNVDDRVLGDAINRAQRRIVFIAPGIRPAVATSLQAAMARLPQHAVQLVLDVDAETSRLGYGDRDFKGMEMLQTAAARHGYTVHHHPGIRIGLLIADDYTLVYSPTPELIEAGSTQPNKPNGIKLGEAVLPQVLEAARDELSQVAVDPGKVEQVKQELRDRPPKEFNVARVERMFNSMLHYVELTIEDYKLASRTVQIDAKLFGVQNEDVVDRLTNKYRLFADSEALTVEIPVIDQNGKPDGNRTRKFSAKEIDRERGRIKKKFIIEAGKYGLLILRRDVNEFERELGVLRTQIEAYRDAVQDQLRTRIDAIVGELLQALSDRLMAQPPEHWRSRYLDKSPSREDIARLFQEDIQREVNRVRTDLDPRIFTTYKDVTYQTFKDPEFLDLLKSRFGKEAIDKVFSEYDVAPEQEAVEAKLR